MTLPPRLLLNIDTGERGADHPVDHALVAHADVINLACGGHAGDAESVRVFSELAARHGKTITAHLSYPDREHFGRRRMELSPAELWRALDQQREMLPGPTGVKLHGALYHEADRDEPLARGLAEWLKRAGFATVIAPVPGVFADEWRGRGLRVLAEAFVERRYHRLPDTGRVALLPRTHADACLTTLPEAIAQAHVLIEKREVWLHPTGERFGVEADTLCVHSDSPIALELAAAVAERLRDLPGETEAQP